jgi:hypothetical protein
MVFDDKQLCKYNFLILLVLRVRVIKLIYRALSHTELPLTNRICKVKGKLSGEKKHQYWEQDMMDYHETDLGSVSLIISTL